MSPDPADHPAHHRTYLRRRGRMTTAQGRALATLSGRYSLESQVPLDALAIFGRGAPLGLEIGFGMGQALVEWAESRPDWNLLGAEVYQPGIGSALHALDSRGLGNVRILEAPAQTMLEAVLGPGMLDEVRIFFPDPWPKKRHHKRRLLEPLFVGLLADRLSPGGLLWVATDWEAYGEWIVEVLDAEGRLERERPPRIDAATHRGVEERPRTRFEVRGRRLGHQVWDLRYVRKR